jgi:aerobic carbon-monoxide dehydrogenase small subunit
LTAIALTVNARAVRADVEPRTHLADFLRDGLDLTGTHLGCEHGVCGACTLLLDGVPARSCITYAVGCDGAEVTTIEGLDDDEIVVELRAAFTREHALQCGYCTPGMLIAARDLALRLPGADERKIRIGMSGNLCRCTGYVGIIRAIHSVIAARRGRGIVALAGAGRQVLGPAGSGHGATTPNDQTAEVPAQTALASAGLAAAAIPDFKPETVIERDFIVPYPPQRVFNFFGDIPAVAACLPGASISKTSSSDRVEGEIRVKLGPISASFAGAARIERDSADLSGRIIGAGNDRRSRSSTQGEIRYHLVPVEQGAATRVVFSIGYSLRGMLAQFARPGLVRDLVARMTADFARNLERTLAGASSGDHASGELNGFAVLGDMLRQRLRHFFRRLIGGSAPGEK